MKIEIKAIDGVKEVPEDMKNAAIARKKAFVKKVIPKKKAPKAKKVVAKETKPVTKTAKVVAAVKKVITKGKHGKKNRSKNR